MDDGPALDDLFASSERIAPEGYRTEVVEGAVFMSPQRDTSWEITLDIVEQLRAKYPRRCVKSAVRVDYPGHHNGFASDVTLVAEGAGRSPRGLWSCEDVEFVAEVISEGTAHHDYGPKRTAYATAGVAAFLIADPHQGKCRLHSEPVDGEYLRELTVAFGMDIDLTTPLGLVLRTGDFPRD